MANGLNIDIGISKDEVIRLTKDAIREQVSAQINTAMQAINISAIIESKVAGLDDKLLKLATDKMGVHADKFARERERIFREEAHKAILADLEKKPLNGNVTLSIAAFNAETSYGKENWD